MKRSIVLTCFLIACLFCFGQHKVQSDKDTIPVIFLVADTAKHFIVHHRGIIYISATGNDTIKTDDRTELFWMRGYITGNGCLNLYKEPMDSSLLIWDYRKIINK